MTIALAPELPGDMGSPGGPVWALTGEEILAELDSLHTDVCRAQTRRLALLAGLDGLGYAKDSGARNTADLLARRHRLDPQAVHRDVKLATALPRYPTVQQALDNGPHIGTPYPHPDPDPDAEGNGDAPPESDADVDADVGLGLHPKQAEAIVGTLEQAPDTVPVEDVKVAETEMVAAASTLPPADLRRLGRGVVERLDPDGREPDESAARERQKLWLSRTVNRNGLRFGGYLADENAELFQTLIDACSKPHKITDDKGRQHLDPRTKTQRQADALIQVLNAAAANGNSADLPSHGGIRPHLMVTIRLNELLEAGRRHTGDLLFGERLSASAVRMLACDANVIPIVLGTNSQPLDVGQDFRTVTPAIRKALIARDKGCVICGAPPGWCDAHHIIHWADGGDTSVENTALVCKPDHRGVHQGIWNLQIVNGTVHVTGPHYKSAKARRTPAQRPPPAAVYAPPGGSV